ncbi:MAG: S-adenosylmethionine:tRNA ribosyltransferase-isomerase [Bacteroidales bacterium]|nr:S-adenosylmethionine:tRNA ribosyltransferase-isomerase [Bacteroidales bacterium]
MIDPGNIRIEDYDYQLPSDRIAQYPLAIRDSSKLLICKDGKISEDVFSGIDRHLPENSLLVFNDTRVIHARLIFRKSTGGQIEIFCLEPLSPYSDIQAVFQQKSTSTWKCLVGHLKRWKSGTLELGTWHKGHYYQVLANRIRDCGDGCFEIEFCWDPPDTTFAEILEVVGMIPLPPYINRKAESSDNERYQTIYAANDGSVAAPTAGLHFTTPLLDRLSLKGIETEKVTLHVGVGTFRPVAVEHITDHVMHHEKIVVSKKTIERLLINQRRPLFAVGTTSARTLESLYWLGVRLISENSRAHPAVSQWTPYITDTAHNITVRQSLEALLEYLAAHKLDEYSGETQLMIVPGYRFRLVSGLITNFHMPQSTLLLLVAAMIGEDWKRAYQYALQNNFRFLSYGDSCLFLAKSYFDVLE